MGHSNHRAGVFNLYGGKVTSGEPVEKKGTHYLLTCLHRFLTSLFIYLARKREV